MAKRFGAVVTLKAGGHYRIAGEGWTYCCPSTPSDHYRGMKNLATQLRKASNRA